MLGPSWSRRTSSKARTYNVTVQRPHLSNGPDASPRVVRGSGTRGDTRRGSSRPYAHTAYFLLYFVWWHLIRRHRRKPTFSPFKTFSLHLNLLQQLFTVLADRLTNGDVAPTHEEPRFRRQHKTLLDRFCLYRSCPSIHTKLKVSDGANSADSLISTPTMPTLPVSPPLVSSPRAPRPLLMRLVVNRE